MRWTKSKGELLDQASFQRWSCLSALCKVALVEFSRLILFSFPEVDDGEVHVGFEEIGILCDGLLIVELCVIEAVCFSGNVSEQNVCDRILRFEGKRAAELLFCFLEELYPIKGVSQHEVGEGDFSVTGDKDGSPIACHIKDSMNRLIATASAVNG